MRSVRVAMGLSWVGLMVSGAGCAIPQKPGNGITSRELEQATHTGYWLYLPSGYSRATEGHGSPRHRPLVVTFHGTSPFDTAHAQIREWQQEADRYGFIVIAPELRTNNCFMQFPLHDAKLPCVVKDEKATLAIMDEVIERTNADASRVLATGWSTGGYQAHYMVNRHPDRFSCLAVREATFSESMMDPQATARYRDMKVAIICGQNDFLVCRYDSKRAVAWYRRNGLTVEATAAAGLGHVRIPEPAASFFASTLGVEPQKSPELAKYEMKDIYVDVR